VTVSLLSVPLLFTTLLLVPVTDQTSSTLTLTNADDGKSFSLLLGDKVEIELTSASGTGYAWLCTQKPAPLLISEGVRRVQVSLTLGGKQKEIHTFSTNSTGQVEITCNLVRPWERGGKTAKSFRFELKVERG
jgi:predicted secreted protein